MPKKEGKFKSIDGKKTMTVIIEDVTELEGQPSGDDVQAYQASSEETFTIVNGTKRLTITIAE